MNLLAAKIPAQIETIEIADALKLRRVLDYNGNIANVSGELAIVAGIYAGMVNVLNLDAFGDR